MLRLSYAPKTREERADAAEGGGLQSAKGEMRDFLMGKFENYSTHGESELAIGKLTAFHNARYGTIADAKRKLGEISTIKKAFIEVQPELYAQ